METTWLGVQENIMVWVDITIALCQIDILGTKVIKMVLLQMII